MSHVRQQIRDAVKMLLTGATSAAANVFAQRILPVGKDVDKVCLIYALNETSVAQSMQPVRLQRIMALRIEGQFKSSASAIDNLMDDFAVAVEAVMATDRTFGGLAFESGLISTNIQHDAQGEKPVAIIRLEYQIIYHTRDNAPEVAL